MHWLRLLASLVIGPLVYGLFCVPLLAWWTGIFPRYINNLGGTFHVPLVLSIEAIQGAILLLCGAAIGLVSGTGRWQWVCVVGATADMLLIGVIVQHQFWESMPVWHHWIFFGLIVICLPVGVRISRLRGLHAARAERV